ncbi:MAG TPA: hypothetical protein VN277_02750 [Acidiferrobacterales bacterium]|nr:hypothetical protein [Acidiferrobacterales bacterium]
MAACLAKNVFQLAAADVAGRQVESNRLRGVRHGSLIPARESVNNLDGAAASCMFAVPRFIRLAKTRERFPLECHEHHK